MNIIINIDDVDPDHIFYQNPVKNTIMDNSNFIRLIYSTNYYTLNNILIEITFNIDKVIRHYEKYIYEFDCLKNDKVIKKIHNLEKTILSRADINDKHPVYRIYNQLTSNNIKLYTTLAKTKDINNKLNHKKKVKYILKISGIWESTYPANEYGLTYKFIEVV